MTGPEAEATVWAAGCVLWRRSPSGDIELALVHRPKWEDWSLPKGKLKPGEEPRDAALREVLEETGMTCVLGPALPNTHYVDAQSRPKVVFYWVAEATGGAFLPSTEISRLVWLPPATALEWLTHERDRELIPAALEALRSAGEVS
ncbi:NUDIX hydrolase [Streptomyces sp. NPDC002851]